MPKYIAITVAGAVSLGCYEAGVLYEIMNAIAQHNTDPKTKAAGDFIYVDIITGASAGGMSSAILTQHLLYDGASLSDPVNNPLYQPWVKLVSLDGLLTPLAADDNTFGVRSILSSAFIDQISSQFINAQVLTPNQRHPAVDPNRKTFGLGLALSNLDGVDYGRPVLTGGNFIYTRYQDEVVRYLSGAPEEATPLFWDTIRQTAVASGAFPFAFAVRQLARPDNDFDQLWSADPFQLPDTNGKYAYTDGGVFQNEPLGLAKNLVEQIGDEDQYSQRFYLFIAPGVRAGTIPHPDPANNLPGPLIADQANFWNTGKALLNAIFQQARFHDWIQAEEVNDLIKNFNERALELKVVLENNTITPAQLDPASKALNALLARKKGIDADDIRSDLKAQFSREYSELVTNKSQATADSWIEAIMTFELAADIEYKDEMNILGITATDKELVCDPLFSFAGFFSEAYRQHDYDLGRNKAKLFLRSQLNPGPDPVNPKPALGPIRCTPGNNIVLDSDLDAIAQNASVTQAVMDLDQAEREHFRDQLRTCIDAALTQAGVKGPLQWAVDAFYIKGKVNDWLGLS